MFKKYILKFVFNNNLRLSLTWNWQVDQFFHEFGNANLKQFGHLCDDSGHPQRFRRAVVQVVGKTFVQADVVVHRREAHENHQCFRYIRRMELKMEIKIKKTVVIFYHFRHASLPEQGCVLFL